MRVFVIAFIALVSLIFPYAVSAETIYKCEDNGVFTFSDAPCRGRQLGSESLEAPRDTRSGEKAGTDETEEVYEKCETGDLEACRLLNIARPGDTWREVSRTNKNIISGGQLSGKYARYPVETRVTIECLPSRWLRTIYIRKDINAVFLRDGDLVASPENNYVPTRQYGSRFSTMEEAARAACGSDK